MDNFAAAEKALSAMLKSVDADGNKKSRTYRLSSNIN